MEVLEQSFIVMSLVILGFIILVMLVVSPLYLNHKKKKGLDRPYVSRDALLSPAEQNLFNALQEAAAGRWWIFPKVSLEDILQTRHDADRSAYKTARSAISSRHVDFALCEPGSFRCLAVIQLDCASSGQAGPLRDVSLDGVFARAGLPFLHLPVQEAYDTVALRTELETAWGRS